MHHGMTRARQPKPGPMSKSCSTTASKNNSNNQSSRIQNILHYLVKTNESTNLPGTLLMQRGSIDNRDLDSALTTHAQACKSLSLFDRSCIFHPSSNASPDTQQTAPSLHRSLLLRRTSCSAVLGQKRQHLAWVHALVFFPRSCNSIFSPTMKSRETEMDWMVSCLVQ